MLVAFSVVLVAFTVVDVPAIVVVVAIVVVLLGTSSFGGFVVVVLSTGKLNGVPLIVVVVVSSVVVVVGHGPPQPELNPLCESALIANPPNTNAIPPAIMLAPICRLIIRFHVSP